ncbi:Uncharacterized protein TCM_041459 [Theobroma cacao]|uniref:Reverse transcriptase Ty1/copia-type domain-containing protein n=1 Tax=Theobroma cacao TaxID=3641 RepID=A0A061GVG0_THECC|nr:Uncharacterized protein TCM_041459 [Theobroma cacao]
MQITFSSINHEYTATSHVSIGPTQTSGTHVEQAHISNSSTRPVKTGDATIRWTQPSSVQPFEPMHAGPLPLELSTSQDKTHLDLVPEFIRLPSPALESSPSPISTEQFGPPTIEPHAVTSKRIRQVTNNLFGSSISHSSHPSVNSTVYLLSHNISYFKFSMTYTTFSATISSVDEPRRDAMAKEISTLEANHTWILVLLPLGKCAIDSKWIFKVKFNPNGIVKRHKV